MLEKTAKRLQKLEEALLPKDKTLLSIPVQWIDMETGEIVAELPPAPVERVDYPAKRVDYRKGLVYEAGSP
jgi:predicted component of type VI protein secretion system